MFSVEKVLKFALEDEGCFLTLRGAITNDLALANPYYLQLCTFFGEFYDKYHSLPKTGDVQTWIANQGEHSRPALKSAYQHILSQDISQYTTAYVLETAITELRKVASKNAIKRLDIDGAASPESIADMLSRIQTISTITIEDLVDVRDTGKWLRLEDEFEIKYKTGIQKLDHYIGGMGEELVFVLAGTGVGKTTFLINLARSVVLQGGNVLHISLELFNKMTAHRYYRRIAEASKDEFYESYDEVKGLVDHFFNWSTGQLHVIYRPAFSITVADVKSLVKQYVDQYGKVDLIVLDYLDLLSADIGYGKLEQWAKLGRMSHEIRALCSQYSCTVASAAQATKEGLDAHSLQMKHMGGAIAKLQAADIVFGLVQSSEELEVNQGRLGILKTRESHGRGTEIPLYIDMEKMLILDVDSPDSKRIILQQMDEKNNALGKKLYT